MQVFFVSASPFGLRRHKKREIRSEYPLAEKLAKKRVFEGPGFFFSGKSRQPKTSFTPAEIRAALLLAIDIAKKYDRKLKLNAVEKRLLDAAFEDLKADE